MSGSRTGCSDRVGVDGSSRSRDYPAEASVIRAGELSSTAASRSETSGGEIEPMPSHTP
jgi:hypothetical protein